MLVTHPKAASPPSPGTDGHGRTVSLRDRGMCGAGGLGPLPGGGGCWSAWAFDARGPSFSRLWHLCESRKHRWIGLVTTSMSAGAKEAKKREC